MTEIYYFIFLLAISLLTVFSLIAFRLRKPSRHYEGPASVSNVYDTWTVDPKMKFYWGNHLHAGFYGQPSEHKDFVRAKFDMIDEMVHWGIEEADPKLFERLENPNESMPHVKILDIGCGVGGTALHLAERWPNSAHVTGITISRAQAKYATALARSHGQNNVAFVACDAMDQAFADQSYDFIWSLESEPHMPDKERFISEIVRLLKPGGRLAVATWNVRDFRSIPLTTAEKEHVQYLIDEWCHTKFDTIHESVELYKRHGLTEVISDDWTMYTLPSWREAILVALRDVRGLGWITPKVWWLNVRDAYTIIRLDSAFRKGLCEYGVFQGCKAG